MSDFHRNIAARGGIADRVAIDAGLRAHMIRVYNYMASAVALTGVVAWLCFQSAVVMNDAGAFIELQGTAEGHAFRMDELNAMIELAKGGIARLIEHQRAVLAD